jgi:cellulose synthase/poly-beta-1,6-N-acetylglucosamine synthase-like glycosyltransferase
MTVALIISVYKDVNNLRVILDALKFQTYSNFEIVISEDGNNEAMKLFVDSYPFINPIKHITQIDEGWRKNKSLNNAIRSSSADYLIFIDGDCVPHHKFIESHVQLADAKGFVAGKRVKLGPKYSEKFKAEIHTLLKLESQIEKDLLAVLRDGAKFYEEAFYFNPSGILGFIPKLRKMKNLKGCNMSFHKATIEAINGFDEDYELPAIGEDVDLLWRLGGLGYKIISARNLAVQYHLYHRENWTDQSINLAKMEAKMKARKFVCDNGLIKMASNG